MVNQNEFRSFSKITSHLPVSYITDICSSFYSARLGEIYRSEQGVEITAHSGLFFVCHRFSGIPRTKEVRDGLCPPNAPLPM